MPRLLVDVFLLSQQFTLSVFLYGFIKRGEIVLEVNGTKIDSVDALSAALEEGGRTWRIAVSRGGRVVQLAIGG